MDSNHSQRRQAESDERDETTAEKNVSRRGFVRTTGAVLVSTGVGTACGDIAPTGPGASFRIVLTGLNESATSGGQLTVTPLDVPGFEPRTFDLPAGGEPIRLPGFPVMSVRLFTKKTNSNYRLNYAPPDRHILDPSVENPRDVTWESGQDLVVGFSLIYTPPGPSCALSGTITGYASEGAIVAGGRTIILTLNGVQWVPEVGNDNPITAALISGIDSAQSEATGWDAVVKPGLSHANVVRASDTIVRITLPPFAGYAIRADEEITVTVPAAALTPLGDSIVAYPNFIIPDIGVGCYISGTIVRFANEDTIVAGGLTMVLHVIGDQWVPEVGGDNAITRALISNIDSAQPEAMGWDTVVKPGLTHANVVRTSNTTVTITLPPFDEYAIVRDEMITAVIPANALLASDNSVRANPSITIENVPLGCVVGGTITTSGNEEEIVAGGLTMTLRLTGDQWESTVGEDNAITSALLAGIDSAQSEAYGWDAVVKAGLTHLNVVRTSNTVVTITLPPFPDYAITAQEIVSIVVPASALRSSTNAVVAGTQIRIANTIETCAVSGTITTIAGEDEIVAGGLTMVLTLTGDEWVASVGDDNWITRALIAGIDSAQSEATGWDALVKAGLTHTNVVRTSNTVVTINLPAFPEYSITANEIVTVEVPASATESSAIGITATPRITIPNLTESCTLTGTITAARADDIVAGGRTIILTLTAEQWAPTVGADNPITSALIAGIDSAQSESSGWDAVVRAGLTHLNVVRNSDTVVTITLPPFPDYAITLDETITATIPASAMAASQTPLVATPSLRMLGAISTAGLIFHSDWSSGTGNSDAAVRDINQAIPWTSDIPTILTVESAAGLFSAGFANCLRVFVITDAEGRMSGGFGRVSFVSTQPRVGDDLYWRMYMRHDLSDAEFDPSHQIHWAGNHPVENFDRSNDPNIGIKWNNQNDGRWDLWFMTKQATGAQNWHLGSELNKFTEYRVEWHAHILTESTYHLHVRIYDASGRLLYDDNDFSYGGRTLADLPIIQGNFSQGTSMLSKFSWYKIGNNGSYSWLYRPPYNRIISPAWRFGGACMRRDNWCGPYNGGV